MNIGFLYIKKGSFSVKLRRENNGEDIVKEVFLSQGMYLDDERISKDYQMVLMGMSCTSGTGKVLRLSHSLHTHLQRHMDKINKYNLHPQVLKLSPPMPLQTQKSINAFLSLFKLQVLQKGQVIVTEKDYRSPLALILIDGDIIQYKRVVDFTSAPYEEKEAEKLQIQQNQSLTHTQPEDGSFQKYSPQQVMSLFGQKIGYVPLNAWTNHRAILLKEPSDVSLVVESLNAIVLTVKPYDMNVSFLPEVRQQLLKQSCLECDLIDLRSEQIFLSHKKAIQDDIKLTEQYTKTKKNYE